MPLIKRDYVCSHLHTMWNATSLVVMCAKPPSRGTHQRRDNRSLSQDPLTSGTAYGLILSADHRLRQKNVTPL